MPSNVPMRGLRISDELYLKLKKIAEKENRSYNKQAAYILQQYVDKYELVNGIIEIDTNELYK